MSNPTEATATDVATQASSSENSGEKPPFVFGNMVMPFVLLICCFAAWGVAANMTDPPWSRFSA